MPVGPRDPFDRMARLRAAQPADDPEAALRLVVDNPPTEPEPVGAPVPGAMAVLALTAFTVSVVLAVCRLFGMPIGVLWVLAPMWGSALIVAGLALAAALVEAGADARSWVRRRGR